jgi:hypothetical protein
MLQMSNRSILREIKSEPYKVMKKLHDLEKGGKKRTRIIEKQISGQTAFENLLLHLRRVVQYSISTITDKQSKHMIDDYFRYFDYFEQEVIKNTNHIKPMPKKIISQMQTYHTTLFRFLLERNLISHEVSPVNTEELGNLWLVSAVIWENDF